MLHRPAAIFTQLSQVTADMARDLRTPTGNPLGQTEVATSHARSVEYYQELVVSNLRAAAHCTDERQYAFLARLENVDAVIEQAWLDIDAKFARMADYFDELAERPLCIVCSGVGRLWADPVCYRAPWPI